MKNNNKIRFFSVVAVLLLMVSCVAMFAGCKEKASDITDIIVTSTNQPKLTYVQGQELDLSKGSITVLVDGKERFVPLSADGVSVSGYNKDQLGKQTLTVSYNGKTATYEITVVERVTVENYEKSYFVGASFDNSKGKIKIMKDDGSSVSVNLNNAAVTVSKLDSATAGEKTVTVKYSADNGESYETSIKVTVYAVGDVTLKAPDKAAYSSHEKELSLAGGYLTVKADGNSTLAKLVDLTPDMISGFDPSAATSEHRNTPLIQTITVTYGGKTFTFEISVQYSAISLIQETVVLLKDVDWTQLKISDELGAASMEAMTEYFGLTQAKKNLIKTEDAEQIVRGATLYTMHLFAKENLEMSDVFVLSNQGQFMINAKTCTPERMSEVATKLDNPNEKFNVYSVLLRQILADFPYVSLSDYQTSVAKYIVVPTKENVLLYVEIFEFILDIHKSLSAVPENWTVSELSNYSENITSAVSIILDSGCFGPDFDQIYSLVEGWRAKADFFDIIYSYYYYVAEKGQDHIASTLWNKVPFPKELRRWYLTAYAAMYDAQYMYYEGSKAAYLCDTTNFMLNYFAAYELAEDLKANGNELCRSLYALIDGDLVMDVNMKKYNTGYMNLSSIMLTSDAYAELWQKYLEIVKLEADGTLDFSKHKNELEAVFDAFLDLSPTEQFGFISSLHLLYSQAGGTHYAFDMSKSAQSRFVFYLANYYASNLPEDMRSVIQSVFLTMESFSIYIMYGDQANGLDNFKAQMSAVIEFYKNASSDNKAKFNEYFGDFYNKYGAIYYAVTENKRPDVERWNSDIAEFVNTVSAFVKVNSYMTAESTPEKDKKDALIILASLYERAESIYSKLINSEDNDLLAAISTNFYNIGGIATSIDVAMFSTRNVFLNFMLNISLTAKGENGNDKNILMWELYDSAELENFFIKMSYVVNSRFAGTNLSLSEVKAAMEAFRLLSDADKNIFYIMGSDYYYNTLYLFCCNILEQKYAAAYPEGSRPDTYEASLKAASDLAKAVIEAEIAYVGYSSAPTEENLAKFKAAMESAKALYESIPEAERAIFDSVLGDTYSFYQEKAAA